MSRLVRILGSLVLVMLASPAIAEELDYMGGYDGRWEGGLKSIAPEAYDAVHGINLSDDMTIAFVIKNESVSVYSGNSKGNWREAKPGHFQILTLKTNATITAIDSSNEPPDKQGWVETWNFSATHKDRDHLLVIFTRVVNNYTAPEDNHGSSPGRFMMLGVGEMHRVTP
ncbi:MAG TPA: hypothetical protein VFI23_06480 [Rhizomicrobium sp.]|nr:hypothetical protein [Rhizomicrobium sp.]